MANLTVLGIGNILMRDEGVGVRLMERVRDGRRWPGGVEFIDGGVGGLSIVAIVERAERLVVFDAAEMGLAAGEFRILSPDDLADESADGRLSLHELPFAETLRLCEQFSRLPARIRILAIQPGAVEYGLELSVELSAAMDKLADEAARLVQTELAP